MWINGPFGGGKTVTAYELARRVDGAVVCDPEYVGFGLHRTLPQHLRNGDFQDLRAWRAGVVEVLDLALREHDGPVIAPMTLVEPAYVEEIHGGLRSRGHDVCHVALHAPRAEVLARLRRRPGALLGNTWAIDQLDRCRSQLERPGFAVPVSTEGRSVAAVADEVAAVAGLEIAPSADGRVVGWLRRTGTSLRHLRVDLAP